MIKELLTNESKWSREYYAEDVNGNDVAPWSDEAVKWCIEGAIQKCYPYKEFWKIYRLIEDYVGQTPLCWNSDESTTFEDIKRVISILNI